MSENLNNQEIDFTGLVGRVAGEEMIKVAISEAAGALVIYDVDNIGKVNDAFGLEAGNKAIAFLGEILSNEDDAVSCHLGGDKFMSYFKNYTDEMAYEKVNNIIARFYMLKENEITTKSATLSAGVAMVEEGIDFAEADSRADKALYYVKQTGKAGASFYQDTEYTGESVADSEIQTIIDGKNSGSRHVGAMDIEYKYFSKLFEFLKNLSMRYDFKYSLLMVKLENKIGAPISADENEKAMLSLEQAIATTVRGVDINSRYGDSQFLTMLMETDEVIIKGIMDRVFNCFYNIYGVDYFKPVYEVVNFEAIKK